MSTWGHASQLEEESVTLGPHRRFDPGAQSLSLANHSDDRENTRTQKDIITRDDDNDPQKAHGVKRNKWFTKKSETVKRLILKQKGRKPLMNIRSVPVPPNRFSALRKNWIEIVSPLVENLGLDVRINLKRSSVEIRGSISVGPPSKQHRRVQGPTVGDDDDCMGSDIRPHVEYATTKADSERFSVRHKENSLEAGADFLKAFILGFDLKDALALLRLDDLFIESFKIQDVKRLKNQHLNRCIARIAGTDGRTKHAIENSTRTRIVLANTNVHVLGSFTNIRLARNAICSLILGSPAGKVYESLRSINRRLKET